MIVCGFVIVWAIVSRSNSKFQLFLLTRVYSAIRLRENRLKTFRVILLKDKQTNKQINEQIDVNDYTVSLAEIAVITNVMHVIMSLTADD